MLRQKCYNYYDMFALTNVYYNNNIHEKITQFWLAESNVVQVQHASAKSVIQCKKCNTSANYTS